MEHRNGANGSSQVTFDGSLSSSNVTKADLNRQLFRPDFCHVETGRGRLLSHSRTGDGNPPSFVSGQPIRFTRLAASRLVTQLRAEGHKTARVKEIV